jgi:molybdopterin synthase sulfur carrier subunit
MTAPVPQTVETGVTQVKLVYLARLREVFGVSSEQFALPGGVRDVAGLLACLRSRGGVWEKELDAGRAFKVAVNHVMAGPATPLDAGSEVAIFPPVTGG